MLEWITILETKFAVTVVAIIVLVELFSTVYDYFCSFYMMMLSVIILCCLLQFLLRNRATGSAFPLPALTGFNNRVQLRQAALRSLIATFKKSDYC
jgi:hypothetical protein